MKNYYKLTISKTAKPMGGHDRQWETYDHEVKEFDTLKEIKAYLKEQYFYAVTKRKSYQDDTDGQIGWIYCFKSDPSSYDDCHHFEQHWVNVYKIASEPVLIKL